MKHSNPERGTRSAEGKAGNIASLAVVLSVLLHGVVFSVPAYLIYSNSKTKIQKSKVEQKTDTIIVDVAMVPAIQARGEKSVIKETEGKKPKADAGETGLNGQAEKKGNADAEKEMLTYQDAILQKIQQARRYPVEARQKGIEGEVGMAFTIIDHGMLKSVEITGASGSGLLDEEAVATIKRAAPFPEIPADHKNKEMTLDVKIKFNIE